MRTVPVNQAAGPFADARVPARNISMVILLTDVPGRREARGLPSPTGRGGVIAFRIL
ncbi:MULTISPECIES: hypothetical protein [Rhizobium/Agrobacterium group]|jgi:hypothetical protein|uniref:hypothetical protein n=1 Tax=Rhizobium/Agrobacterium group TaxID=227290 RepID=UPI00142DBECF|nr:MULTISPECIES: hypothetical protein [Rhizobium/Agrobacterium group]